MAETSPAYLWYPKDVLSSGKVSELTGLEECWYRRALDHSWLDEGLPSDPGKCARRIGKHCTAKAAAMILDLFFVPHRKDASKMVNEKQEKLRKELREKVRQKSDAGKRGMAKRWGKRNKPDNSVITALEHSNNIAVPIASSKKDKKEDAATQAETADKPSPVSRRIWTDGVQMLVEGGLKNHDARSLLGKLGKEYTQTILAECVAATMAANPVNPEEYLIGKLKSRKNGNGFKRPTDPGKYDPTVSEAIVDGPCQHCGDPLCLGGAKCEERQQAA